MSAPAEIIDRIKKLLRLARSSNLHEAARAMEAALRLAQEHRVAMDSLDPDAAKPNITHQETDPLSRLSYDRMFAARLIQRFFRVQCLIRDAIRTVDGWTQKIGVKLAVVGTASDIEISLYVYHFLVHHFAFCWTHHRGRSRSRRSYIWGMFQGIYTKLLNAEPPTAPRTTKGTELELSMDGYMAQVFGETKPKKMRETRTANGAAVAGYLQGRKTEIRPAIKNTGEQTLALNAGDQR